VWKLPTKGASAVFGVSITGVKILSNGKLSIQQRRDTFDGLSVATEGVAGHFTGGFGRSISAGRNFANFGITTPGLGIGAGPSFNTRLTALRYPVGW
jgi:hypothetical protein